MAVKPNQSAVRALEILEQVAHHQPIGITELAKLVDEDKSAVQRSLVTLAHAGWIAPTASKPTRWELTPHIHAIAHIAHASHDLRHRARPALQALRDETGETACLNVMDRGQFVVLDAMESAHHLRVVFTVGESIPAMSSATSRAILPYVDPERWVEFLGREPDAAELAEFHATVVRGYSISSNIVVAGFTNIAAPIFEADQKPVGVLLVSGPSDRLKEHHKVGVLVSAKARSLSRGPSPSVTFRR